MLGIFDSGIGGLSFVKKLLEFGFNDFIYLKDSKNFPYGKKTKKELLEIGEKNINFLVKKGASQIFIACHTMSSCLSEDLVRNFPRIQIRNVVSPTIEFLEQRDFKKIGIIGTKRTISSLVYSKFFKKKGIRYLQLVASDLASEIENGKLFFDKNIFRRIQRKLSSFKPEALILACTHFSLITQEFKKLGSFEIIDPIEVAWVKYKPDHKKDKKPLYYTTSNSPIKVSLLNLGEFKIVNI